jgi:hypothetical protein
MNCRWRAEKRSCLAVPLGPMLDGCPGSQCVLDPHVAAAVVALSPTNASGIIDAEDGAAVRAKSPVFDKVIAERTVRCRTFERRRGRHRLRKLHGKAPWRTLRDALRPLEGSR